MGIFNILRVKMGSVLIALIGLSILAFLIGDLLGPNSVLLGGNKNEVGEIAGETISLERYQQKINEFKYNFQSSNGRTPSDAELNSIRQQAWDFLVIEVAFKDQYESLGLEVSDAELVDMVQGNNIDPTIRQTFMNQETGEFDRERAIQTIQNIAQAPAEQQAQWLAFEASLIPSRERIKFDELLVSTNYITSAEAKKAYQVENETLEVDYLYISYASISDSSANPSDAEMKAYFNKNKKKYESDASRMMNYVKFDILPSKEDSLYLRKDMESLKVDFMKSAEDSTFARANSDRSNAYKRFAIADLPKILASNTNILKKGDVLGPYIENGAYILYKASDIYEADSKSVKASHILIKTGEGIDEAVAKKKANEAFAKAKAGEDFSELAKEYSEGPTAINGGDLGWFKEGAMVSEFNDAVFAKTGTGVVNEVVKSQYGFHIIKVTEEATAKSYAIAIIEREILPTEESRDQSFRKADYFGASNANYQEFAANAKKEGYDVQSSGKMNKNLRSIGGLENSRQIVRWAFTDASLGAVSEVYETPTAYVVAVLTGSSESKTANFDDSKAMVRREVKKEKQAEIIKIKLAEINAATIQEIASTYGADAKTSSKSDLKISESSLPSVGQAPVVIGTAFGMEINAISKPLEANNGIVILQVLNKTPAPEIADYTSYKDQLVQRRNNSTSFSIKSAVEANAEIVDERYKFF
jgi:peptidyl-prolyl cis-trans isomerase D